MGPDQRSADPYSSRKGIAAPGRRCDARTLMTAEQDTKARSARAAPLPIAVVSALMAVIAVVVNVVPPVARHPIGLSLVGWAVLLAMTFWLVEVVPIHLEWAGQAYSMSLSEVPVVLALIFCPSPIFVVARVLGGGLALAVSRKQPLHK